MPQATRPTGGVVVLPQPKLAPGPLRQRTSGVDQEVVNAMQQSGGESRTEERRTDMMFNLTLLAGYLLTAVAVAAAGEPLSTAGAVIGTLLAAKRVDGMIVAARAVESEDFDGSSGSEVDENDTQGEVVTLAEARERRKVLRTVDAWPVQAERHGNQVPVLQSAVLTALGHLSPVRSSLSTTTIELFRGGSCFTAEPERQPTVASVLLSSFAAEKATMRTAIRRAA
jgi:hypothetical protein